MSFSIHFENKIPAHAQSKGRLNFFGSKIDFAHYSVLFYKCNRACRINFSKTNPSPPLLLTWKKFKPRIEEIKNDSVSYLISQIRKSSKIFIMPSIAIQVITTVNKRLSDNFIAQSTAKSRYITISTNKLARNNQI
jgi:hypothetical protein